MIRALIALVLLAASTAAQAQSSAVLPANSVWGNPTGARAQAKPMLLSNPPFAASATVDTTNAANITSGILPLPRLSGSYTGITGVGTLLAGATGTGFTVNLGTSTILGELPVPNGGTGAATFTANLPLIGNGASAIAQGTRSGNTTAFATVSGAMTSGNCVSIDASGNFVAAGGACTTGGGGGTVASSTIGQVPVYTAATTITGAPALTYSSGALTVGTANTTLGTITLEGNASGAVTVQPQAVAGAWNFNLPTTAGTAGQVLTSQGGGSTAMTWTSVSGASGVVNAGSINQLGWYAANGSTISGLATANNGTLVTSAGGVPSISSTLPAAVQGNITGLGTITSGVWNGTAITGSNIATNTVSNSNKAQMPAFTTSCNPSTVTANMQDCTVAQIKPVLSVEISVTDPAFGAKCDGSTDDTTAIQNAINSLPASGGIVLFPVATCRISSALTIGNGTTSAVSTRQGVYLVGRGNPDLMSFGVGAGKTASAGPKLQWLGATTTAPMISVAGPLQGWGIQNLFLDCGNVALRGLQVISAAFGDSKNLSITGCVETAIYSSTNPLGGYSGGVTNVDSLNNAYSNIYIGLGTGSFASGIRFLGESGGTSNTDFNSVSSVFIQYPSNNNQIGIVLALADSNVFHNINMVPLQSTQVGIYLDYSVNNTFPLSNIFYGLENTNAGGTGIGYFTNGTPGAGSKPNYVIGSMDANGVSAPANVVGWRNGVSSRTSDQGAWATYTPSASCGTATFTVNSARYTNFNKAITAQLDLSVTAAGSCGGNVSFSLPATSNSSGALSGREVAVSGANVQCMIVGSAQTTGTCTKTNGSAFATGERIIASGVYESQ